MVILLVVCILWVGGIVSAQPVTFSIAQNGQPRCSIATAKEHQSLAEELAGWLQQVTRGEKFPLQNLPPSQPAIVLATAGDLPDLAKTHRLADLGPEGYIIR
ncbi:MAG: hypothetical protein NZ741_03380, partial [Armatimonadetes bacterium]|nr:hypothetical protein [Armatimonadota bacterium]